MNESRIPQVFDVARDGVVYALAKEVGAEGAASGVVLVLTASGSRYRFDLAADTVYRVRDTGSGAASFELRRDEEDVAVLELGPVEIGRPHVMVLDLRRDGIPTVRTTNEVISVTYADDAARRRQGIEVVRG